MSSVLQLLTVLSCAVKFSVWIFQHVKNWTLWIDAILFQQTTSLPAAWAFTKTNPRFVDPFQEWQHVAKGYFDIFSQDCSCRRGIRALYNVWFCVLIMQHDLPSQSRGSGSLNENEAGVWREHYQLVSLTCCEIHPRWKSSMFLSFMI